MQQDDPKQPLAFLGYACGSMRPWVSSTLAIDYSSYDAEAVSILAAAVWALSLPGDRQVHFHVDSQSVLGAANGSYQTANPAACNTAACLARQAVQILEAQERDLHWHWVPGHKGIAGNEISDSLSKAVALGVWPDTPLPHALWQAVTHPFFGWLWRASTTKTDCPSLASLEGGRYEMPDQVPPALLSEGQGPEAPKVTTIALQTCTLNVQSLHEQKDALWHLLGKERFGIVGLQETRMQRDYQCKGRAFFEVHAAGKNGNHGTSLLFAQDVPYGWQGDRPLHILPEHISCLHAEPSILVCAVHAPGLHLCCVSAHAPHSGNSPSSIQAWWRRLQGVIPKDAKGRLLLLVDANARLGSVTSTGIDAHAGEEECPAGECLRELADKFQLWIPATCFDRTGRRDPSASEPTWVSPHGTLHRVDYIGVPLAWNTGNVTPWVHGDLLPARQHEDHWAACVSVQFLTHCIAPKKGPGALPRDPSRATEQCRQAVLAAWDTAPPVPWEANVHEHMELLQRTVVQAAQATPPPPLRKKRPFVSEEAAALLHDCKRLRRSLRGFDRLERQLRLRTILHALSRGRARPPVSREGWTLRDLQAIKGVFVRWLHTDRTAVRTTIQADKAAFAAARLRSLQEAGQAGNAKAFYKALAPLRPPGKKILKPFAPLVITRGEDNQLPDPIALTKDKREHFAALEAGEETTLAELFSGAPEQPASDCTFDLRELPTLTQIEHLVRSIQLGKAPGPSSVPGWVWKSNTTKAARALLPLFLKAHVRLTEPIQSKATDLISLFKGKGSARDWCNHRAICLLEEPGKLLRKASRAALLDALQPKELHQGGMPGSLLPSGHHLLRTFFATARAQRSAHAALFFDVTSAYYRVVRECFFKAPDCDEAFLTVLRRLEVPAEYFHEVVCWARGAALLERMSPHGQRVIKTFMSNTHFKMKGDGVYVGTHAGVRPGDTIADVLFAFVQADLVKAIEQAAAREGLLECPVREAASLPLSLLCPTWADDSAILLADRSSERLLQRARCLFQIAHREMMRRAMSPNYKAGKTEAVVHLSGKGKRELARELFVRQQSRLHFTVGQHTFTVGCVPGYSHLGGRVTVKGNAIADLRQKLASAFAAARPLARTVLRNKHLPIAQRRQLLNGLSLSRITHTAATWPRLGVEESALWSAGYSKLVRLLTSDDRWTGAPSLPGPQELCRYTGMPLPDSFLRCEPLHHFARCLTHQQETLLAMLQAERQVSAGTSWLEQLRKDLQWLSAGAELPAIASQNFPEALQAFILECPTRFHRLVRKAASAELRQPPTKASASNPDVVPHTCPLCGDAFASFQALRAHRFAVHHLRSDAAAVVDGTSCPCCLTEFWSRDRVLRHVQHDRPACLEALWSHGMFVNPLTQVHGEPGQTAHYPATRLAGPLLPLTTQSPADAVDAAVQLLAEEPGMSHEELRQALDAFYFSPAVTDCVALLANEPAIDLTGT